MNWTLNSLGSTTQQAFVIIREQKGSGIQFPSLMHVKGLIQEFNS